MSEISFPSLALKAEEMAKWLFLSPQAHQRLSRTERIWRYRSYEGGEPAGMIDWTQSARGERLLVREPEEIKIRPVLLWSQTAWPDDATAQQNALLLMTLGHMLLKAERTVGWLAGDCPKTRTASILQGLFARFLNAPETQTGQTGQTAPPEMPDLRFALLVLSGDLGAAPEAWLDILKSHAARGSRAVLLDFGQKDDTPIHLCARNNGWPVIKTTPTAPPETALLHLFEEALKGSI